MNLMSSNNNIQNNDPLFYDVRSKSAVIFSMNDKDEQKILFLIRFSKNKDDFIVNNVFSCTNRYIIKYINIDHYYRGYKIGVSDGTKEFYLIISDNTKSYKYNSSDPILYITSALSNEFNYGYYIKYPKHEEKDIQVKSSTEEIIKTIGKYKNMLDFVKENNDINEKFLKELETKYKNKISLCDQLINIKKNIDETNSKIQKIKKDIDNNMDDLKIECKICFLGKCQSILYCGHFLCDGCINRLKNNDDITCPYCKKNVKYHKFYLN